MHSSLFFRLFPPPAFMVMRYAGLDISDDAVHCLQYAHNGRSLKIGKYAELALPPGIIEGGDFKDEKRLSELLTAFDREHGLSYVKVSLPEEKAYLFQTDVPSADMREIAQNIEFKLEDNVPLSAADAIFYFDLMPMAVTGGKPRASVSVVPRSYIERYISVLHGAGISPVAFEVVPKAMARAVVAPESGTTELIIHLMPGKTGMYVVSGGVVCFTSTIGIGTAAPAGAEAAAVQAIAREINRVYAYWTSHDDARPTIGRIILAGDHAPSYEEPLQNVVIGASVPVKVAEVWANAFDLDSYVPPISKDDSLGYAVTAGLAMDI